MMIAITVPAEFWSCAALPEGILENWLKPAGALVRAGEAIALVRVEDALHDLPAPASGRLVVERQNNAVVEPGAVIGHLVQS